MDYCIDFGHARRHQSDPNWTHSKQNQFNNNSDSISGHSVLSGGGSYMETQATETNKTSPEWSTL